MDLNMLVSKKMIDNRKCAKDAYFCGRSLPSKSNHFVATLALRDKQKSKSFKIKNIDDLSRFLGQKDVYVSQCFFWHPQRLSNHVSGFSHFWIDLDFYKNTESIKYKSLGEKGIALRLYCRDNNIPEPSRIVYSGQGGYAIWLFNSVIPSCAKKRFQRALYELTSRFYAWGADIQCRDLSRVLRMPGTINGKTGKKCVVIYNDGPIYDFGDLCDELLPMSYETFKVKAQEWDANREKNRLAAEARYEEKQKNKKIVNRINKGKTNRNKGAKSIKSYFHKALVDIKYLIKSRGGKLRKGDIHAFILHIAVLYAQILPPEEIISATEKFVKNVKPNEHDDGTKIKSVEKHLSTLVKKAQIDSNREGQKSIGYTYKTIDIIENLGITKKEMKTMEVLIDREERNLRRNVKRWTEGRTERPGSKGVTREEYEQNSLQKRSPWKKMGIGRTTYFKRRKKIQNILKTKKEPKDYMKYNEITNLIDDTFIIMNYSTIHNNETEMIT